jgi:hypothetical protein
MRIFRKDIFLRCDFFSRKMVLCLKEGGPARPAGTPLPRLLLHKADVVLVRLAGKEQQQQQHS